MNLPELLESCSRESDLRFLLIGGHAVIAHGHARTTFDVDFLVCHQQLPAWIAILWSLGYRLERQEGAFALFSPTPEGEGLDLMLVNMTTFEGIWRAGVEVSVGGQVVKVPSLDHLLALKLHVLKQNLRHRRIKDLDDVIRLALVNKLDVRKEHYRKLFEKYGTIDDYHKVLDATRED